MTPSVATDLLAYNLNIADFIEKLNSPSSGGAVRSSFVHELAREGDLLSAEVLFDAGQKIDLPDEEGRRPLHEAAFFGHIEMMRFLIECGAVVDAPIHPFGHTALYLAVQQSRYDAVQYLIKRAARLGVEDALMGTGLLHIAAAKNDMKMAGMLIAAGINVFHEDKKGQTARDIAARARHSNLEQVLLKIMEHHAKYMAC